MRILFCSNTLRGFCNFRLDVVTHLIEKGNEAVIVYPHKKGDEDTLKILPAGCRAVECRMSPNGKSLFQDVRYFFGLMRVFGKEKPDIVFNYTVKPNIYGGLCARIKGIPSVAVVPGLGYVFARKGVVGAVLRRFYLMGLRLAKSVFALNSSDMGCLVRSGLKESKIVLLDGGEGVNLNRYPFSEGQFQFPRFLMISRLLYTKGYREFVTVARRVKDSYPGVRFEIAGNLSETNPAAVPQNIVQADEQSGYIRYLGYIEDIAKELADPDTIVVLPSYYKEGMNRSLMEACSCGRPVITTNLPGLKELVSDGENGYLAEPGDPDSLYEKIVAFLELSASERKQMGYRSRELAENRFDVDSVKTAYDKILSKVLNANV